ncbi:putative mitochondrial inner membrane protease subunit 1 [Cercophora samala]|uniref:Mitochondrial inner membrane protease subunit n=1 Tax=Cercophora samala TaxID=330535 RepID=A0AA39Z9P4_9PEZI|nr:putative mitochondrial inner membrane protease subunit 1 [Cercophora samala]
MSSLYRLGAITWRHNLSPHSSLRPLARLSLSLTQPRPFTPSNTSSIRTTPPSLHKSYSTTTTIPDSTPNQPQPNQQNPHHDQTQDSSQEKPPPPPPPPLPPLRPLRLLFSYLKLLALLHLIWNNLLSLAPAQGPSMLATYPIEGTWHLTSRLSRLGRHLAVGDIVTFTLPDRPSAIGVKRVIGLPGDYVLIGTPGEFWACGADPKADDALMLQVPEGHVYLVGDNLPASNDSRIFGPVPMGLIRGKVIASMEPSFTRGPFANFEWVVNPMKRAEPPTREQVLAARSSGR